jgi:hypothetical protein
MDAQYSINYAASLLVEDLIFNISSHLSDDLILILCGIHYRDRKWGRVSAAGILQSN